ncbi:hypothetical protein VAPA_2c06040 [Variovorax paradoxus B4]|uniref:Uncharacterized protein n=2 Tax=Variovorax paradoxus TaxID=34073 RepID=T1XKQ2_VARPD|nr:hypothetical protein VAPA_2c06040 [Variovorax paradoxus B4]
MPRGRACPMANYRRPQHCFQGPGSAACRSALQNEHGNPIIMKIQSLRSLCVALLLGASAVAATPVFAHGAAPARHGGVVQPANDMSFELVAAADGAVIHVVEGAKAVATVTDGRKTTTVRFTIKEPA